MIPTLKQIVYSVKLPVSKTELVIRPYTMGEEKTILTVTSGEDKKMLFTNLIELVRMCIISPPQSFVLEELTSVDFYYLVLMLRARTKESVITFKPKCVTCEKETDKEVFMHGELNLIDDLRVKNPETFESTVKIQEGNVSITVKLPKFGVISSLFDDIPDDDIENKYTQVIKMMYAHFVSLTTVDRIYTAEEVSADEFVKMVSDYFTEKDVGIISDAIATLTSLYYPIRLKCPNKHVLNYDETDMISFFL